MFSKHLATILRSYRVYRKAILWNLYAGYVNSLRRLTAGFILPLECLTGSSVCHIDYSTIVKAFFLEQM